MGRFQVGLFLLLDFDQPIGAGNELDALGGGITLEHNGISLAVAVGVVLQELLPGFQDSNLFLGKFVASDRGLDIDAVDMHRYKLIGFPVDADE